MRRVTLGETGITSSRLGFGAASLGSRVEAAAGRRALEAAFDAGVTWLDLAPVYGGGAAEDIAAPFVRAHRDGLQICTKAGLGLAGGAGGGLRRQLMPLARRVLSLAGPAVAGRLRGAAPKANAKLPLTPELLTRSLEASLTRLGIETVDLFALHAPDPAEVCRPDILRALEDLKAAGKARAIGVAGDAAAAAAALRAGGLYGVIQMAVAEADAALLSGRGRRVWASCCIRSSAAADRPPRRRARRGWHRLSTSTRRGSSSSRCCRSAAAARRWRPWTGSREPEAETGRRGRTGGTGKAFMFTTIW